MCDLGLSLDSSPWLRERVESLGRDLEQRQIQFRPHFWLSDEWFTPDGTSGIAIPFYLAHPRLARLEESQMLEVEGGTPEWCLRILRHETGHAIDNAYRLHMRRRRQELFGPSSEPYPEDYTPRPYSRSFVVHLQSWYAQSHPAEDFAETFAVWLTPDSQWRSRYAEWPALRKLEYMDTLMREIGPRGPTRGAGQPVDPLPRIRRTLRTHYQRKRSKYRVDYENFYDRELRRLFSDTTDHSPGISAAAFLSRVRKTVRRRVARFTGEKQYQIDQVIEKMIRRSQELSLRLACPEDRAQMDFTALLTAQIMNDLHSGRYRLVL
ncbi:MAG: putative zinc-binding metallopeptidase [Candidatus Bipolaricaulota bacterium]|nr:putative zinc-binding metallopeptidase [Candidatus Bipolaricaulota bacterium]